MQITGMIDDESYAFETSAVTGLDVWAFHIATGLDLEHAVAEITAHAEAGTTPPFRLAVVAIWLAARPANPHLSFEQAAQAVTMVGSSHADPKPDLRHQRQRCRPAQVDRPCGTRGPGT